MKFILFVEGYTEEKVLPKFFKRWLDPQLEKPVGVKPVRFEGWSELCKDVSRKSKMYLEGPDRDKVIAVISLLDLYGPTFYPNNMKDSDERYSWGKENIEGKVCHPNFFHFFAVHEIEAWLLSDPSIFPDKIQKSFPGKVKEPESVNFNDPLGKLLERLYEKKTGRSYKKVVNGRELFHRLDPNIAYMRCPKLKELLDKMLELAKNFM